ncbi:Anti-sigma-B factor antagonist [Thermoflexales bacterium]|jgi:anti-sigma B factor antagonist|nr:Anti-sigma-B factor antagonist [Thermoflexales bacterium]
MNIEMRELKHVNVVKVSGRVDSSTAPDLEKSLQGLLDSGRNQITLDLQATEYMSSAGLRVLVAMHKAAKKSGGGLCLAQPSARVKEVLDLAGLTPVFTVYADLVEAVGSF